MLVDGYMALSKDVLSKDEAESHIKASKLATAVVWRFDRQFEGAPPFDVWDMVESEEYPLPTLVFHVPGGDKANKDGNKFYWLLTVIPDCFIPLLKAPVGGMYKSNLSDIQYNDLINSYKVWDSKWVRGTDNNWGVLEYLVQASKPLPKMTGSPVIYLATENVLKTWDDIISLSDSQ